MLVLLSIFFFLCSTVHAADYWPTEDWRMDGAYAAAHADTLKEIDEYLFPTHPTDTPVRTDAALIIKNGYLVYENYGHGYTRTTRHLTWSASKSVLNALVGIAVRDGKLALGDSICRYLPAAVSQNHCAITVCDLLHWSSGLGWSEDYETSTKPTASSVLAMLYGVGHRDMSGFVASHDPTYAAGTHWAYSSGDSVLLHAVVRAAMGDRDDLSAWNDLFLPIGMNHVTWERDAKGTLVGSSYLWATARELAKFAYLFLNDGVWDGKPILPEGWVHDSLELSPAIQSHAKQITVDNLSGAHWWINRAYPEYGGRQPWPGLPADAFAAEGHWGQYLVVIPSWNMIVVRLGDDRVKPFNLLTLAHLAGKLAGAPARHLSVSSPQAAPIAKPTQKSYKNSQITLALGFTAKEYCSCLFVAGLGDEACRAYVKIPQLSPRIIVDKAKKKVIARFLLLWRQTAVYEGDRFGCRLR